MYATDRVNILIWTVGTWISCVLMGPVRVKKKNLPCNWKDQMVQKWPHDDLAKGPNKHPSFSHHPPSRLHCYHRKQALAWRHKTTTCSFTPVHHMTYRPTSETLHLITSRFPTCPLFFPTMSVKMCGALNTKEPLKQKRCKNRKKDNNNIQTRQ